MCMHTHTCTEQYSLPTLTDQLQPNVHLFLDLPQKLHGILHRRKSEKGWRNFAYTGKGLVCSNAHLNCSLVPQGKICAHWARYVAYWLHWARYVAHWLHLARHVAHLLHFGKTCCTLGKMYAYWLCWARYVTWARYVAHWLQGPMGKKHCTYPLHN